MVYRRPARTFVLPAPRVPDGLTISSAPFREQPDIAAPLISYRIAASSSASRKTMLDEFYRVAFRKKIYATIDALQADLRSLDA